MPLSLRRGRVTAVVERVEGLARLEVDGEACVAYPCVTGPVAIGDDVIVNVQARELALGSGGFDVLYANLTRGLDLAGESGAHVMKLPYTPLQFAAPHVEEGARDAPDALAGTPVVACSLHSQVAPVCAALSGRRVAYVQVPGGALPLPLSDAVRAVRAHGLVEWTVSVGPCFGGDVEAVSLYSALVNAREAGAEAVVCAIGPGVVGTASRFGHGGTAAADVIAATSALGGVAVLALRVSERDARERHRGVSHHAESVLGLWGERCRVAWPAGCPFDPPEAAEVVDVADWREACDGLPLASMGRGADDDPWFFAAAFAAGRLAGALAT
jgi:Protein of unknown function (DUF3866)